MGKNCCLIILFALFYGSCESKVQNTTPEQKNSTNSIKEPDISYDKERYQNLIIDFFSQMQNAKICFDQIVKSKKIGEGFIKLSKNNFIKIVSTIGRRDFIIEGDSLKSLILKDLYLNEEKSIEPPKVAELLFGDEKTIRQLIERAEIVLTVKDKVICCLNYSDLFGSHKILFCFNREPFKLTFWRIIDRKNSSYITIKSFKYNYKNS